MTSPPPTLSKNGSDAVTHRVKSTECLVCGVSLLVRSDFLQTSDVVTKKRVSWVLSLASLLTLFAVVTAVGRNSPCLSLCYYRHYRFSGV
jgi:hypothetical protein